jgi:hypothetical protein
VDEGRAGLEFYGLKSLTFKPWMEQIAGNGR